ncbi:MAG: ComEC/Rec2 family competence protein [Candidatus Bipolaricaulota bacterium]|nr:ComEC/Rec2 family competence protein [Candidatus Bipolaricaulota bacterium]
MKYPILAIAAAFSSGIIIGRLIPGGIEPSFLFWIALASALLFIILSRFSRRALIGLLLPIAVFGLIRFQSVRAPAQSLYRRAAHLYQVTGTVVSYPSLGDGYLFFTVAPDDISARIRVTWFLQDIAEEDVRILYGDRLRLTGPVQAPEQFPDFDYRAYLARQGIFATMAVDGQEDVEYIGQGANRFLRMGDRLRQWLLKRLDKQLGPEEAGLVHGLLFGDRTALSDDVEGAFRRTGLMHLLAVSGLHLGIFLAFLWFGLRLIGLRPIFTYPIVGIAILAVLWIVGPRVSLLRASLLFAFLAFGSVLADLGIILRRWVNSFQGLAAAAILILAVRPTAIFDVGFQLSFSATAAILLVFAPPFSVQQRINALTEWISLPKWLVGYPLTLIAVSAAAQAGTAPVLAYYFNAIYPLVVFTNLVVIPLATVTLWAGMLSLLAAWTPVFPWVVLLLGWLVHVLIWTVGQLARVPFTMFTVPSWIGWWIGGLVLYLIAAFIHYQSESSCTW